jgi:two-component system cell cycle response regulator
MYDLHALVVDDSKVGRVTMMKKLEALDIQVNLAESGQQALDYLERSRPDVIFMDHMMPEMDGFEVTRRIKSSPATRDIPIIIISGNDGTAFVQEARAAGAMTAITKPPETGVLEQLIATLAPAIPVTVAPTGTATDQEQEERKTAQPGVERLSGLEGRLEQQAADLALMDPRIQAIEQRLHVLETIVARPQPDFAALRAELDQRLTAGLAGFQTRSGDSAALLEGLRQTLVARLDHQSEQLESRSSALRASQSELETRLGHLEGTLVSAEQTAPFHEDASLEALAACKTLQAKFAQLEERLHEQRQRHRKKSDLDGADPAKASPAPAVTDELSRLQARLKRQSIITLAGGTVLLGLIGLALWLK